MSGIPFLAIGNDELGDAIGETVDCPHCGGSHEIQQSEAIDAQGNVIGRGSLSWYKCDGTPYIAGVNGRAWGNPKGGRVMATVKPAQMEPDSAYIRWDEHCALLANIREALATERKATGIGATVGSGGVIYSKVVIREARAALDALLADGGE